MSIRTKLTRLVLASVLMLCLLPCLAVLPYAMIGSVEYGNTPLNKLLRLSNGKYVSLSGMTSRVFSLVGNEIVIEQSFNNPERYINVLKGDDDTLYAETIFGTLDIYSYSQTDGLCLQSSTDLRDAAGDITLVSTNMCFMHANGTLICEGSSITFEGEELYFRCIVDVQVPESPVLLSRVYIDYNARYKGFFFLNGHYIYLGFNGTYYISETPSAYPDSLAVVGSGQLNIHYSKQIENDIYFVCSNSTQEYHLVRLQIATNCSPSISTILITNLRSLFDLTEVSGNTICLTGKTSTGVWQIEKLLYTSDDVWQYADTASLDDDFYKLFPISNGYFAGGFYRSILMDSDLNQQAIINETSSYFLYTIVLGRFLILTESVSYGNSNGFRIFDMQNEEFLDFQNNGFLPLKNSSDGNRLVFISNFIDILELSQSGISARWRIPTPNGVNRVDSYDNLVVMCGFIDDQWRILVYSLTDTGMQLQSECVVPHICADISFYSDDHFYISRYTETDESWMYFYRINADYSITYLDELTISGTRALILSDKVIYGNDGGAVINSSNPDSPFVSNIITLPSYGNWGSTYDGQGHFLINDLFHSFLIDTNYQIRGYINGINLFFYQAANFLNPGPASCTKARFDCMVVNEDAYLENSLSLSMDNYPNPFNPSTTISYMLPYPSEIHLSVYNLKGQLVKTLAKEFKSAGIHQLVWDGKDNLNTQASSGIYPN